MKRTNMLSIKNIHYTYPNGVQALKNINLEIPNGMFGLLGPNGAGKSSLMRTIATLQQPDSGSITFSGIDILRDKRSLRRTLGYLPQEFGAYPRTSALTMLKYFASLKGIHGGRQQQVVENLLVKTNLWDARNKSVDKFSGGMKQRFGIAQALLGDPELLIVDEPTAGLDPAERRRFLNVLAEVGEDTVVILSTHIVDDVEELCTRVAIMGHGCILKEDEPLKMIREMNGKLWTRVVNREEVAEIRVRHTVLSTRLKAGSTEIRVRADARPGDEGRRPGAGRCRLQHADRAQPQGQSGINRMRAILEVMQFELRYQLRSPFFLGALLMYMLIHFLAITGSGINIDLSNQVAINSTLASCTSSWCSSFSACCPSWRLSPARSRAISNLRPPHSFMSRRSRLKFS